jgi:hypothetical protein
LVEREKALVHRSAARAARRAIRAMNAGDSPVASEPAANFARDRIAPAVHDRRLRLRGRLNLFQAAMLRWRELHPYNAVHVVRIVKPFERARVEAVIAERLRADGLTGLVLDRTRRRYEYRGGVATVELAVVGRAGESALYAEIERQLNRPFPANGSLVPFRFFAHEIDGGFFLGLAYDHFVAGGDSIVVLLNDIVHSYLGATATRAKPNLYPATFLPLFLRNAGKLLRGLHALSRLTASCRRSMRPRYRDHEDGYNGFECITLPAPAAAVLRAKAKSLGVTFNDVLIAIILKGVARNLVETSRLGRRREVAVASIVNLRSECGVGDRDAFGQFLSSMRISRRVADDVALEALARDVHSESAQFKKDKVYLHMLLAMRINAMVWWFLNARRRRRLYAKAYPVMAGVTSLNVDALWRSAEMEGESRDYLRAVPTGPVAPLVIAATTSGNALALGLSYRRSALSASDAAKIAAFVADSIRALQ